MVTGRYVRGKNTSVGILGGTFDPIHTGHLAVATAAQQAFELAAVLFVPAAHPPHKLNYQITPFEQRAAMVELAVKVCSGFFVSCLEIERKGISYSIDTLISLRNLLGETTRLYFIVGMDNFLEISLWKQYGQLPAIADLVVIDRLDQCENRLTAVVAQYFKNYIYDSVRGCWAARDMPGNIYSLEMESVPISSTLIRAMVQREESIDNLVPSSVARYIKDNDLYCDCRG